MLKDLPRYECLLKASEEFPTLDPTAAEVFLHLLRAGDDLHEARSEFFARHQLSQGRFTVLMLLDRCAETPHTPAALAEESRVTRATMTGLIDTLEKDGLVMRKPDPADRRNVQVRLTKQGQGFIRGILPDYFQFVAATMKPLNKTERKQLVSLLQKLGLGQRGQRGQQRQLGQSAQPGKSKPRNGAGRAA